MIRLNKFEIINYRSCLKSHVDLQNDLTCLIGINGVGKTNLLHGIQLLKKIKGGPRIINRQGSSKTGSLTKITASFTLSDKQIKFKSDISYETDDRNNDEVFDATLKFNLYSLTKKNKWINLPIELLRYADRHNIVNISRLRFFSSKLPNPKELEVISALREFLINISYYSASQFSDPTKCPISFELEEKTIRLARYTNHHEKFLNDLYLTSKNNKKLFQKFLSTVNNEGIGLIDGITFSEYDMPSSSYEVKSGGKIRKIEKNRQLIIPYISIDSIQLSPNQLSEGTFKTLALVFYIITDENDLLLIEEPEVCVHHGLLNSIMSLILSQSKKKQIIISTHSDFVLDRLKPENLLIVKKISKKGTIAKPLSKSLSQNDYKALKAYLSETGNLGEFWKEGGFDHE